MKLSLSYSRLLIPAALLAAQFAYTFWRKIQEFEPPYTFENWVEAARGAAFPTVVLLLILLIGWHFGRGKPAPADDVP